MKGLLLLCAVVLASGALTTSAQSPPALLIDYSTGSQVRLSWANTPGIIVLEEADTLTPTSVWQPFPQVPTLLNGQFSVMVDMTGVSRRFFRLHLIQTDGLPPDPASIAPSVPHGVATLLGRATEFLYTGPNAIQTGVAPGTIEARRAAVVRGKIKKRDNTPLSGATISILNHPEFGQTFSRADGMFDLAVNGGGLLTVKYEKTGFYSVQRQINVPWQDYVMVQVAVMIGTDPIVTSVALGINSPMQVHQGSMQTDADGARRATILFPQGTSADLIMPDGTTQSVSSLNIRATEYTVGTNGPAAMPVPLPPSSGYTYCAELSADEAVASGATEVRFSQPLPVYVENFLGFPVGGAVPTGYYDRQKGQWIASANGRVIKVLSITGGLADLDTDGDNVSDDATKLATLGVTDGERARLAQLYPSGQTMWRVSITHFTPWDCNWPFGPPPDAITPPPPNPYNPVLDTPDEECGSVIGCQTQTLGESLPVIGTPFNLHYQSERTPGRKEAYTVEIPLSGTTLPGSLKRIDLEISVAGQRFTQTFPASPNQTYQFTWDGKDAYGRVVQGVKPVAVNIGYIYGGVYREASAESYPGFGSFSTSENPISGNRERIEVALERHYSTHVGAWDNRSFGMGGWSLSVQHTYDSASRTLLLGNGRQRRAEVMGVTIATVAGNDNRRFDGDGGPATATSLNVPLGVAVGPDGSLYIADADNYRIRRVAPNGIITTVAGNGASGFSGDGGPATAAKVSVPYGVAVSRDGSLYFADLFNYSIRRVAPNGIITTVAGIGSNGFSGDGGPATAAKLNLPAGVAVGPDGSLFIADFANNRIRRVGPDGIITTVAGNGASGFSGDGGPAVAAELRQPHSVAVGPDGSMYISDGGNNRIRRVGPDGIITTVAGDGSNGFSGDGGLATAAALRNSGDPATSVAVGLDGSLFIADIGNFRLRRVGADGIISTIAGSGVRGFSGDDGPATAAKMAEVYGVAVGPDGSVYIVDRPNGRVRRVRSALPNPSLSDIFLASEDSREVYQFNASGRHLMTLDALTGALLYQFGYGADGYLTSVSDGSGNVTRIERSGAVTMAIVAPGGQRTALTVGADGWLLEASNPAVEAHTMTYFADGLMQRFIDPLGNIHRFTYDAPGRLIKDEDPEGGSTSLARTIQSNGYTVTTASALGRSHVYQVEQMPDGALRRTVTEPGGPMTVTLINTDGSEQTTNSDGSIITIKYGPDPRWGMLAPVAESVTLKTPGGRIRTVATTRTATLADPFNLLSLTNLTDTVTDNGFTRSRVYDSATRKFTATSAGGRVSTATLDARGRLVSYQRANGVAALAYLYDAAGRLASVTQGTESLTYTYDAANRVVAVRDASGGAANYVYDAADRVIKIMLPSGRSYALAKDANGNTTRITMPNGAAHNLSYNADSEEQAYTPPGGAAALRWGCDLDGDWTSTTLPGGRTLAAGYDGSVRPTGRTYSEANIAFQYADPTDRLSSMTRTPASGAAQTVNMSYDSELLTAATWAGAAQGQFSYTYDNRFFLTAMSLSSGTDSTNIALTRDADGLLTAIGPFTLTRGGPAGAASQISDGTLNLAIGYDTQGRVATRSHSVNGTPVYGTQITYDSSGRIDQRMETAGGIPHTFIYAYDADGELTQVTRDGATVESYSYDPNGNRSSASATASYDTQDRLTNLAGVIHQFNVDGFLTNRASDTFQYSTRSELISATVAGQTVTYSYDGFGRRVGRTQGTGNCQYLYGNPGNPLQLTAVRDSSNALTVLYYDENGLLIALVRGGARYYVATDQVGTPRVVNDATGAAVKVLQYDSFGKLLSDSAPSFDLPIGFSGGLADSTTGLVHFGLRDYDTGAGRWTARDPALFDGRQMNLYAYAGNDPINGIDLTGLFTIGASAYGGLGGGIRLTFDSTGFKICGELGVGVGGGLEGELNSAVGNTDFEAIGLAEVSAKLGIGKIGFGAELREGGCVKALAKGELGPLSAKVDLKNGKLTVGAKGKLKGIPSVGIGGKIAGRFCGGAKF